jgi:uncharacterized lipoprotein YddW (UPF0748 family)
MSSVVDAGEVSEVRAIWVTRWDYKSAKDIKNVVANSASLGLNRIYLQVRGQADACYRSSHEPWSEELGGDPKRAGNPGFDPLAEALQAATRKGIEVYAWINVLPAWKGRTLPRDKTHVVHTHPEWFMQDANGRRPLTHTDHYTLLNPCLPEVRDHLARVVGEIASRYGVHGVQFDYIRFLGRRVEDGEDVPFDTRTLADFKKQTGAHPGAAPAAWDLFRQEAMNRLVQTLANAARKARPEIRVSVAAVQDPERARAHFFQDARHWTRIGWIDETCPMLYTTDDNKLEERLRTWKREVPPSKLVAGVGAYLLRSGRQLHGQVHATRRHDLGGYSLFSYPSCFISRSKHSESGDDAAEIRAQLRNALLISNSRAVTPALSGR